MDKKTIMLDMDDVIVKGRFQEFLDEFLNRNAYENFEGYYRQDLLAGNEKEFQNKYKYKNIYKYDDGTFVKPIDNCVDVLQSLANIYNIYIVTAYIWKLDVIDAAENLKNKYEYLKHFFPFLDENNFIFINDKSRLNFDIGIDDRVINLVNCKKRILFTESRNKMISDTELKEKGIIRANNWLEIKKILMEE